MGLDKALYLIYRYLLFSVLTGFTISTEKVVYEGGKLTLECGQPISPTVTLIAWQYNNSITPFIKISLDGSGSVTIEDQSFLGRVQINSENGELTLTPVKRRDLGIYHCFVMHQAAPDEGNTYSVSVYVSPPEPTISCTYESQAIEPNLKCDQARPSEDVSSANCSVHSNPKAVVSWKPIESSCEVSEESECVYVNFGWTCYSVVSELCDGEYYCEVVYLGSVAHEKRDSSNLKVGIVAATEDTDDGMHFGYIIGIVVFVLLVLGCVIAVVICICRKKKVADPETHEEKEVLNPGFTTLVNDNKEKTVEDSTNKQNMVKNNEVDMLNKTNAKVEAKIANEELGNKSRDNGDKQNENVEKESKGGNVAIELSNENNSPKTSDKTGNETSEIKDKDMTETEPLKELDLREDGGQLESNPDNKLQVVVTEPNQKNAPPINPMPTFTDPNASVGMQYVFKMLQQANVKKVAYTKKTPDGQERSFQIEREPTAKKNVKKPSGPSMIEITETPEGDR